ncbi:DNAJ heat shock amino-terminal domain protein, putative [Medicago truncatula]|uniref:DNAJ heat shock amino-terminal domain protein, putative n=1 Tax=Medicago truncatula TaxID=3880 RepID=A0A072TS24_MEDTR|nr:DNAJ heat shock amino-terminal domain protein, putative [Medicago truncatula]
MHKPFPSKSQPNFFGSNLLDEALAISPFSDQALQLRAMSMLCLRRFKDLENMLQEYTPKLKMTYDSISAS